MRSPYPQPSASPSPPLSVYMYQCKYSEVVFFVSIHRWPTVNRKSAAASHRLLVSPVNFVATAGHWWILMKTSTSLYIYTYIYGLEQDNGNSSALAGNLAVVFILKKPKGNVVIHVIEGCTRCQIWTKICIDVFSDKLHKNILSPPHTYQSIPATSNRVLFFRIIGYKNTQCAKSHFFVTVSSVLLCSLWIWKMVVMVHISNGCKIGWIRSPMRAI